MTIIKIFIVINTIVAVNIVTIGIIASASQLALLFSRRGVFNATKLVGHWFRQIRLANRKKIEQPQLYFSGSLILLALRSSGKFGSQTIDYVQLKLIQHSHRGRAEKEPRISIPVPAVPVSELLAGKSQRICNSLN